VDAGHERQIRTAYADWMTTRATGQSVAVTVTFKPLPNGGCLSEAAAGEAIRILRRLLNHSAYGNEFKRGRRQLTFFPVREGGVRQQQKRLHYHIQIEVPARWDMERWITEVETVMRRIRVIGHDQCRVTPVIDGGWLSYMLKSRDKASISDAVDVANTWVN